MKILDGKKMVIIGGLTGMGHATAVLAAEWGASVVTISRRSADCEQAVKVINECKAAGIGVYKHISADASIEDEIFPAMEEAISFLGGIDSLICCAHSATIVPSDIINREEFMMDIENNFFATVFPCQAVFPHMKAAGGGSIITCCANAVSTHPIWLGAYVSTKMAVIGWTRVIAREWGEFGIRANNIEALSSTESTFEHPSLMNQGYMERGKAACSNILLMEPGADPFENIPDPITTAYTVCFLCSDMGNFTTNQLIRVDGGCALSPV